MSGKPLLPEELKFEILLALPIKSLLRFKSVCKNWHSLIGSSAFVNRYSSISHVKDSGKLICFRRDPDDKKTHLISLIDCQTREKVVDLEWPPFLDEGIEDHEAYERVISVLGPVNGIYCIFNRLIDRWAGTLVLWNPATREYKHLVPPVHFPFPLEFVYGKWYDHWFYELKAPKGLEIAFGLDSDRNDFKVVVICHWEAPHDDYDDTWHVRVYDLSADSWRTIYYLKTETSSPFEGWYTWFRLDSYPDHVHCYLNGIFHWTTGHEEIVAFDMNNESFRLMKGPPLPRYHYPYQSAWVLKETLVMVFSTMEDNRYPCGAFVWMMMEYGREDSWAMFCSFGPTPGLTFIGIPNDNEIFFCDSKGQLISSNFDNKKFKEYNFYGMCDQHSLTNIHGTQRILKYEETFVLLKTRDN